MSDNRTLYAIGDIHGCYDMLVDLLGKISDDHEQNDRRRYGSTNLPTVILLGDYIDRGLKSREVIDLLTDPDLKTKYEIIALRGNHEQEILDLMREFQETGQPHPLGVRSWLENGGLETLHSYGTPRDVLTFLKTLPATHWNFLSSTISLYLDRNYYFCHAGIDPNKNLFEQDVKVLTGCVNMRKAFMTNTQHYGYTIVHGHTPTKSRKIDLLSNRINVDTGAGHTEGVLSAVALRPDGTIDTLRSAPV